EPAALRRLQRHELGPQPGARLQRPRPRHPGADLADTGPRSARADDRPVAGARLRAADRDSELAAPGEAGGGRSGELAPPAGTAGPVRGRLASHLALSPLLRTGEGQAVRWPIGDRTPPAGEGGARAVGRLAARLGRLLQLRPLLPPLLPGDAGTRRRRAGGHRRRGAVASVSAGRLGRLAAADRAARDGGPAAVDRRRLSGPQRLAGSRHRAPLPGRGGRARRAAALGPILPGRGRGGGWDAGPARRPYRVG